MHTLEQLNAMVETSDASVVLVEGADTASSALLSREVVCKYGSECKVTTRRAVVSLLSNSITAASLLPEEPLHRPLLEKDSCFNEKISQRDIFSHIPKGELSSDNVSCHSLKLCDYQSGDKARLGTFEVHFSDVCERRFVMFDQSRSQKRMIFHPSTVCEFPALFRSPLMITNCKGFTQFESTRDAEHLKDEPVTPLLSDDCASLDAILPPGWRSTLWNCGDEDAFPELYGIGTEGCCLDGLSDCLSKENSEELDALLWSDDEMSSTDHSPSGWTLSEGDDSLCAIHSRGLGAFSCKKRKACLEAETESTATSGIASRKKAFFSECEDLGRGSGYGREGLALFDLSSTSEESSSSSSGSQRQQETRNGTYRRLVQKTRKDKIQSSLQFLRSIISGGESMEAALVLGEAVQYVKNLQLKVDQLEGNVFP